MQANHYVLLLLSGIISLAFNFTSSSNISLQNNYDCADLNINLNKSVYMFSEPIWLELNLILDNKCNIYYQPELSVGNDVELLLSNQNGDTIDFIGGTTDYIQRNKIYDTTYSIYYLMSGFGKPEVYFDKALPIGSYNLRAKIHIYSKEVFDYYSNTVSFNIIEPTGYEKDAHQKWVELKLAKKNKASVYKIKELVDSFLVNYPGSVFEDKMVENIIGSYSYIETIPLNEQDSLLMKIILKNPNSYSNYGFLNWFNHIYDNNSYNAKNLKILEKLESIKIQTGNTLLNKLCNVKIKEIIASIQFEKELKEK
jgi:hypothetical protein